MHFANLFIALSEFINRSAPNNRGSDGKWMQMRMELKAWRGDYE